MGKVERAEEVGGERGAGSGSLGSTERWPERRPDYLTTRFGGGGSGDLPKVTPRFRGRR